MHDLIIIGGGPAGVTAGIYAGRQGLDTLVLAKEFGGQVAKKAVDIENYPGFINIPGPELAKKFEEHLKAQELKVENKKVSEIKKEGNTFTVLTKEGDEFQSKSVIITSGSHPRELGIPGEKEYVGKGVSYCALCDGPVFKNKVVAVIGGGNSGFESALFLSNYVEKIYVLERGSELKAEKKNIEMVEKTGKVEVITNAALEKIEGDKMVSSITYQDLESKKSVVLDVKGVFVEIGYQPESFIAEGLAKLNDKKEIITEPETYATNVAGLFAAGDVNTGKYKQIITACGEGAKAVLAAYEYLKSNED